MANSKGSSSIRNAQYYGKHSFLPPKSPLPAISSSYVDYVPMSRAGEGNSFHQRTSSESFLIEEQPSWLDDLLNEPETPARRGRHRRSSSDSFAYIDGANSANWAAQGDYNFKNVTSVSSCAPQNFDHYKDPRNTSYSVDPTSFSIGKQKSSINMQSRPCGFPHARNYTVLQSAATSSSAAAAQEVVGVSSAANKEQQIAESANCDLKASSDKKDINSKSCAFEKDAKRAKQQFAQRSRVRKLQYIAELERNLQALQAEGSEASAELDFVNQQNLILSMENKTLKQRLESLAQEQLIKHLEHEMLEKEIERLRALYQLQQQLQQSQQSSSHRRSRSKELDQQFASLSLKHKEASSGHDPVFGSMHV